MSAAHSNKHIEQLKRLISDGLGHKLTTAELDYINSYIDIAYVRGQQNGLDTAIAKLSPRPVGPSGS